MQERITKNYVLHKTGDGISVILNVTLQVQWKPYVLVIVRNKKMQSKINAQ